MTVVIDGSVSGFFDTGDISPTLRTTAKTGWIMMDDGSIGDASSGATNRANADTSALFTFIWTNLGNTQAPVSGGRGASAAADFAAHKTITLPLIKGRAVGGAGAGASLTSRALGEVAGEETHVLTTGELAAHGHTINDPGHVHYTGPADGGSFWAAYYPVNTSSGYTIPVTTNTTGISINNSGSGTAHNNIQPTTFLNWMIKL